MALLPVRPDTLSNPAASDFGSIPPPIAGTHVLLEGNSQRQMNLSLSTAEAEIVALRDALRRVVGMLDYLEAFFGKIPRRDSLRFLCLSRHRGKGI